MWQITKQSATIKGFWVLAGQIALKIRTQWIRGVPMGVGSCCVLCLHWSLGSEYSILCFARHKPPHHATPASFLRHVSDFRLLCIIDCSIFTVHKVTHFHRIKFHSEKQKLFSRFLPSFLSMYQIKYDSELVCTWMFDFSKVSFELLARCWIEIRTEFQQFLKWP